MQTQNLYVSCRLDLVVTVAALCEQTKITLTFMETFSLPLKHELKYKTSSENSQERHGTKNWKIEDGLSGANNSYDLAAAHLHII